MSVGEDLYFQMLGVFPEFFEEDFVAAEGGEGLALAGGEAGGYLGDIAYDACFIL